ncbi:helix-turn-helix domain-containing protein [Dechloromonas sp. CZR5]|uniref:helix-turn-helix domain-containing protein n=1 Tax=Dechloromonas sp. CZR5 TaxID=2608630 RepID=UPI00123D01B9|nr:helix-turn-helix domain-containing protein [Dechloromonas sp. CZR5]
MNEQVSSQESMSDETPVVVTETPVGEQLRLAREARGLQIGDISQTLKLGQRQVEALESGDWNGLPGHTFIRGFVRNYARLMQLDPTPMMAQLDRTLEKPVSNLGMQDTGPAPMPDSGSSGASRRDRQFVLFGVALVVLAALAYTLMPADLSALRTTAQSLLDSFARKDVAEQVATPAATSPQPAPASEPVFPPGATQQQVMYPQVLAPAETTPAPAAQGGAGQEAAPAPAAASAAPQLRFLFDKESWIEVRDRDNKVVFSQRLNAGAEQSVSGQGPLSLTIGYAPGVRLFWRGQTVDLAPHTKGDVARLVLE